MLLSWTCSPPPLGRLDGHSRQSGSTVGPLNGKGCSTWMWLKWINLKTQTSKMHTLKTQTSKTQTSDTQPSYSAYLRCTHNSWKQFTRSACFPYSFWLMACHANFFFFRVWYLTILVSGSPSQFLKAKTMCFLLCSVCSFYFCSHWTTRHFTTELNFYSLKHLSIMGNRQTAISMFSLLLLRRKKQSRHPRRQKLWGKQAPLLNCFYRMCRSYIWLVISRSAFWRSAVCVFEVCVF